MREIAEKRTKRRWGLDWGHSKHLKDESPKYWRAYTPIVPTEKDALSDGEFIAMASNQFEKLLKVAEIASKLKNDISEKMEIAIANGDFDDADLDSIKFFLEFKQALDDLEEDE